MRFAFFGLTLKPGRSYAQTVERSFRVTMACYGDQVVPDDRSCVKVEVNGETFVLCVLAAGKGEQQLLDIVFEEGDEIRFSATGKSDVHITGNYFPDDEGSEEGESESGSEVGSEEEVEEGDEEEEFSESELKKLRALIGEIASSDEGEEDEEDEEDEDEENIAELLDAGSDEEIDSSEMEDDDASDNSEGHEENDVRVTKANVKRKAAAVPETAEEESDSAEMPEDLDDGSDSEEAMASSDDELENDALAAEADGKRKAASRPAHHAEKKRKGNSERPVPVAANNAKGKKGGFAPAANAPGAAKGGFRGRRRNRGQGGRGRGRGGH